jgi:hypothetical protein
MGAGRRWKAAQAALRPLGFVLLLMLVLVLTLLACWIYACPHARLYNLQRVGDTRFASRLGSQGFSLSFSLSLSFSRSAFFLESVPYSDYG